MAFADKNLRCLPPMIAAGRPYKRYHVDQHDQPLTDVVVDAAYAMVERLVPPPDDAASAGWIVVHRGGDTGAYIVVYTWVWDNVIEVHSAAAGQPAIGCPDTDPTNFAALDRNWAGCVWELGMFEHERSAWVRHALDRATPDVAAYLDDQLTAAMVGR